MHPSNEARRPASAARGLLIGCGVFLVVITVAGIVVVPRIVHWARSQITKEAERQRLADAWEPPAAGLEFEGLFPGAIGDARLVRSDDRAAIPELSLEFDGRHAVYRVGDGDVEIFVTLADGPEKEAVFDRVGEAYERAESGGGIHQLTRMGYRAFYASPEHGQNHFWSVKGWLVIARAAAGEDREPFVIEYLRSISAVPVPE